MDWAKLGEIAIVLAMIGAMTIVIMRVIFRCVDDNVEREMRAEKKAKEKKAKWSSDDWNWDDLE